MRPGRLGPGRAPGALLTAWICSRFNEAGAIRPRKAGRIRNRWPGSHRFNEAGAIRPRKAHARQLLQRDMPSFNEAGAIRPRKDGRPEQLPIAFIASMRPGRLGPGRILIIALSLP